MPSWPWMKFIKNKNNDQRNEALSFASSGQKTGDIAGRKLDRFKINNFHNTQLRLEIGAESYMVPILNLSSQGLAFANTLQDHDFNIGDSIQARFSILGKEALITLCVRHKTQITVGCFIENFAASYSNLIESYFIEEIEGAKLFPVSIADTFQQDSTYDRIYLMNPKNTCSLYLESHKDKIHRLQINLLGNSIQINEDNTLAYGFSIEDEDVKSQFSPQVTIKINQLPPDLLGHCLRFINQIDHINTTLKAEITGKLQNSCKYNAA